MMSGLFHLNCTGRMDRGKGSQSCALFPGISRFGRWLSIRESMSVSTVDLSFGSGAGKSFR